MYARKVKRQALRLILCLALAPLAIPAASASQERSGGSAEPVQRDCRSSVYGALGAWMADSVVSGPLGFVRARRYAESRSTYFRPLPDGRYRGLKLLAVVKTGWQARIVVPAPQQRFVALAHHPSTFGKPVVPADGVHDETLIACPPGRPLLGPTEQAWTQFNGEIVVAGRRCVLLHVYASKHGKPWPSRPRLAFLPLGAACPE